MPSINLLSEIKAGNKHRKVPKELYNENLLPVYQESKVKTVPSFDPEIHLSKLPIDKTRRITLAELGIKSSKQISEIGVSDPFPLFTDEAVEIMRQEILDPATFDDHARYSHSSSSGLDCVMRGYATPNGYGKFTYEAWKHPETNKRISTMAGVELEVIMDYEIAHVNIGMKSPADVEKELISSQKQSAIVGNGEDIPAIVGWHNDSYPMVCVLMLSDTTNMIGGETSLRTFAGEVKSVPSPQKGYACVLQGRLIEHIAPKPIGISERITTVTSYRAKNPLLHDGSVLSTVKPEINFGSNYNKFYKHWIDYRVGMLTERLNDLKMGVDESENFDKDATIAKLKGIEQYLNTTYSEMGVSEAEWYKAAKGLDQ